MNALLEPLGFDFMRQALAIVSTAQQSYFPVVDEKQELVGVFSLNPSATMVPFRGRWIGQHELAAAHALLD